MDEQLEYCDTKFKLYKSFVFFILTSTFWFPKLTFLDEALKTY